MKNNCINYKHRILAILLTLMTVVSLTPKMVFAATSCVLNTNVGNEEFFVGVPTEFTLSIEANEDVDALVKGYLEFDKSEAVGTTEYFEAKEDVWKAFSGEFRAEEGFSLVDEDIRFRVTFKETGEFNFNIILKTPDGEDFASLSETIVVEDKSLISTDIENKVFVVGELGEFSFTTVANDNFNEMVNVFIELNDNDAVESIKCLNSENGEWVEFSGKYGSEEGFSLSEIHSANFQIVFNKSGSFTIDAYIESVESKEVISSHSATVTVKKRSPALSFEKDVLDVMFHETNVSNKIIDTVSDGEYIFSSSDETIVKIKDNGTLVPVSLGTATIKVVRKDNAEYVSSEGEYIVNVLKGTQAPMEWEKEVLTAVTVKFNETYSNAIKGGGAITYSSSDENVVEVDSQTGELNIKRPGNVTITAQKDGMGVYDDQSTSYDLIVTKADCPEIKFEESNPDSIKFGEKGVIKVIGGYEGGRINYVVSNDSVDIDQNGVITTKTTGYVGILAYMSENEFYEASNYITCTVSIVPADLEIYFQKGKEGQTIKYGEKYQNVLLTGIDEPLTVTYSSSDNETATVNPTTGEVTALKEGSVFIYAKVEGNSLYNGAEDFYELTIERASQVIEFQKGHEQVHSIFYGQSFTNPAIAQTTITYSSSDEEYVTVNEDGSLNILKAGKEITITATAAETNQYEGAVLSYRILINKADYNVVFENPENEITVTFNDNNNVFSNVATPDVKDEALNASYSIIYGNEFADIDSVTGKVTIKGAGSVTVKVSFAETDCHISKEVLYTLIIKKADQKIEFVFDEYYSTIGKCFVVKNGDKNFKGVLAKEVGEKYGTGAIKYYIYGENTIIESIDSETGEITFTNNTGIVSLRVSKDADENYNKASDIYCSLQVVDGALEDNSYYLSGNQNDDTDWYCGDVSIIANDGYEISYDKKVWFDKIEVVDDGIHEEEFYIKNISTGIISKKQAITVKKDETLPEVDIKNEKYGDWKEKLLTVISINVWESETLYFTIDSKDEMCKPVIEYYIKRDSTEVMTEEELNQINEWVPYSEMIRVGKNQKFVVYVKATDEAGNYNYASTNGIIFDRTSIPNENITVSTDTPSIGNFYVSDIVLDVSVIDALPSSGIKTISYEVFKDDEKTQQGTLFSFEEENPDYDGLVSEWKSSSTEEQIVISSELNESDNIVLKIYAVDNAGNITIKNYNYRIYSEKPEFNVEFQGEENFVEEYDGVSYYNGTYTAFISIYCKPYVFNSDNFKITINDSYYNKNQVKTYVENDWSRNPADSSEHVYKIEFNGNSVYSFTVEYEDIFGNKYEYTSKKFAVDTKAPEAELYIEDNVWLELLETFSFGFWTNEKVIVKATATDETSPVKPLEYYIDESNLKDVISISELELLEWKKFEELSFEPDDVFSIYLKVTDYAGHVQYVCSDVYILDDTDSGINIVLPETEFKHNDIPLYNGDVSVDLYVSEQTKDVYSGINKVEYWIECDNVKTKEEVLFKFEQPITSIDDLVFEYSDKIIISAKENESCNVVLFVRVTDNAGNVSEDSVHLDIDSVKTDISIEFDNNVVRTINGNRGYYDFGRTAIVTFKERGGHFSTEEAQKRIKITAKDLNDKNIIEDTSTLIKSWSTEGDGINTVYKAVIEFKEDANYTFELDYSDLAGNGNLTVETGSSLTPYEFTIDNENPFGEISLEENVWENILEIVSYTVFKKDSVDLCFSAGDRISPVILQYYVTEEINGIDFETLEKLEESSWTEIQNKDSVSVSPEKKLLVYLKVSDYSGNYVYIRTDGIVLDSKGSLIEIKLPETECYHNGIPLYNKDVNVDINVLEKEENTYSGINTVEYWVTCDGVKTQEGVLFSFDKTSPLHEELVREYTDVVTIQAEKNNSCEVVFNVRVIDNAGTCSENSVELDIDCTKPEISLSFSNNKVNKIEGNKGYFNFERKAIVSITERKGHFNAEAATNGISITATNFKGENVFEDCSVLIGEWTHQEKGDVHTVEIDFSQNANYEWNISYTDIALNSNNEIDIMDSITPFVFAVDNTKPDAKIKVGELGIWDELVEILTFGLWSKDSVEVTATWEDEISPIQSVFYYKNSSIQPLKEEDLEQHTNWKEFTPFEVSEDEKFVIYMKIVDYAGNVKYISTNGIIVDDTTPTFESIKPEITITPELFEGVYNSDVTISVSVMDIAVGESNVFAGLNNIRYEIYNMGELTQKGMLYEFIKNSPAYGDLKQEWSKSDAIVVNKDLNNSNDVKIKVFAEDNAGNVGEAECDIKIDITAPEIEVKYDNNAGDRSFNDGVYFNRNRVATIIVTERNFDSEKVKLEIFNTHGYIPTLTEWKHSEGTGNGDDSRHIAYVEYDKDGDYKFNVSCADTADNKNSGVEYGDSLAPEAFTIDKTYPVLKLEYDNNNFVGKNYFNAYRTATITITEHNFETSRFNLFINATDREKKSTPPTVSEWKSSGDKHVLTISYSKDAVYTFDMEYTDKAGNAMKDIPEQTFCIDTTEPELFIEKIKDGSANNDSENIGFVLKVTDTNLETFNPLLTAVVKSEDKIETKTFDLGTIKNIEYGKTYVVENIELDGIYYIKCEITDKAGNSFSKIVFSNENETDSIKECTQEDVLVTFSVNRNGSTYSIDNETKEKIEKYYIQNFDNDIVFTEVNVDTLEEYTVILNDEILKETVDYNVSVEGGEGEWKKYVYTLNKELFAEEGEYKVSVSSKDKAGNNSFSEVNNIAVEFNVDRTKPSLTISGLSKGGRYLTEKKEVDVIPTDAGGMLDTLKIVVKDSDGNPLKDTMGNDISVRFDMSGEDLINYLSSNNGIVKFEIPEGFENTIEIQCSDKSVGDTSNANTYFEVFEKVTVSPSAWIIFYANKPLFYTSVSLVILLIAGIIALIIKKRKKQ